ncbi:MAG: septal ring lytic transglycosylase RlpA family protein [Gammaproteobacteria bacterium]|nr:septal ring lytic transglycosylase RlpA family protein [Gammaproteobacteria bacterium]
MSASDAYQASRYNIQQDRGPSRQIDPSQVREIIPMIEPRTLAGNKSPYTVNGLTYRVMPSEEGYRERGFASWYGEKFHGHKTSNGEIYDMYQISAAHKTMPIPGFLRVTNLENERSIIVRVNDRGPFHSDRVIDLSYAAAYMLGFDNKGTAMVEVEAIVPTLAGPGSRPAGSAVATSAARTAAAPVRAAIVEGSGTGNDNGTGTGRAGGSGAQEQYLQVGAFSDLRAAEQLSAKLRDLTSRPVFIRSVESDAANQALHRVRVGPIPDAAEAARIADTVVAAELGRPYTVRD